MTKELDCVIDTGRYVFQVDELGRSEVQMLLEYEPMSIEPFHPQNHTKSVTQSQHKETWNQEQIGDFVRKLGFVDKKKGEEKIKYFLHLNQVLPFELACSQ